GTRLPAKPGQPRPAAPARASGWLIWFVAGFSALSLVLNLVTPSAGERPIWAPVALVLLASSAVVAFSGPSRKLS
ncbi:MAG: hypothetical protein ACM3XO_20835, partial [Bacteroidota bacterium]